MAEAKSFFYTGNNNQGILLCHTLGGDPNQMTELGKKLNKKGYTVSCPLYDGHGKEFEDIIHTEVTDWYKNVVDAYQELSTQVEKVYVIGMSIGGSFAVKLAEEYDVAGLVTINAPIIGFDVVNDAFQFSKNTSDVALLKRYHDHRLHYFRFVVELGQIQNIQLIQCPLFVLQGSLDLDRYKTSSMMLMEYVNHEKKQRKDYPKSRHLLLQDYDKKEAIKDIVTFIEKN